MSDEIFNPFKPPKQPGYQEKRGKVLPSAKPAWGARDGDNNPQADLRERAENILDEAVR